MNPPRDSRAALSPERIVDAAIAFADAEGVDALSMRKLATSLGAGVMSLYNHVANKDELLDRMVDQVCADMETPSGDLDWRTAIRRTAVSAHQAFLAHPWAATEWNRRTPGQARLLLMESILRTLADGGLDPDTVYRGYHAITMHLVGFSIQELGFADLAHTSDLADIVEGFLADLDAERFPHFRRHVEAHFDGTERGDEFTFVLDLLLDGLDRARR